MNLPKAIEIQTRWKEPESIEETEELDEARKLGIEALKCIERLRRFEYFGYDTTLPGETKE